MLIYLFVKTLVGGRRAYFPPAWGNNVMISYNIGVQT